MKILILNCLFITLTILFFNKIQLNLIAWNFSWTFAKIAPYLLSVIFGLVFIWKLRKSRLIPNKFARVILQFLLFVLPFGLSFALNPIYEGDFSKEGQEIKNPINLAEFGKNDLLVLTIMNCPFCRESTFKMNTLIKRNPNLKIKYIVCSKTPEAKLELRSHLDKRIQIDLAKNLDEIVKLSGGKFPTFVKLDNGKAVYKWNNMQLGVRSLDWIESKEF